MKRNKYVKDSWKTRRPLVVDIATQSIGGMAITVILFFVLALITSCDGETEPNPGPLEAQSSAKVIREGVA